MTSFRLRIMAQVLPFLLIAPGVALAQAPPTRAEAAAALSQPDNAATQYTRQQIDQLVAPIALYPDQLLTQVLMAATYPDQIAAAAQWLQDPAQAGLKGDALATALQPLPWDPSVKALAAFPQLIQMLAQHIEWTQALGVAFATQQHDVMARIQALRHLAMRSGRIRKMHHLQVREEANEIVIMPAEPDRVFVPVYNPVVVYGPWPDRDYPPVYIPPPPDFVGETVEPGFQVSAGYAVVAPLWGWSRPDWREDRITINRTEYTRINRNIEVDIGPGDSWRHRGPVILAAPAAAPAARAAAVPAGTVDPRRAAAVTALPRRAAAEPERIQTRPAGTPPAPEHAATPPAPQHGTPPAPEHAATPAAPQHGTPPAPEHAATPAAPQHGTPPAPEHAATPPGPHQATPPAPEHAGAPPASHPGTPPAPEHAATPPVPRHGAPPAPERAATPAEPRHGAPPAPEHAGVPPAAHPGAPRPPEHAARPPEPHRAAPPAPEHAGAPPAAHPGAPAAPEHAGVPPAPHHAAPPAPEHAAQHPPGPPAAGHGSSAPSPAAAHVPPAAHAAPAGPHPPAAKENEKEKKDEH